MVPILSLQVRRSPKLTRDAPSMSLTDGASVKLSHLPYAPLRRKGTDRMNSVLEPRTVMELHLRMYMVDLVVASLLPIEDAYLEPADKV